MSVSRALALLADAPLGTRLVVRYHDGSGAADALGYLRKRSSTGVVVETRRGEQQVVLSAVIAARLVPEPPAPRPRRSASGTAEKT